MPDKAQFRRTLGRLLLKLDRLQGVAAELEQRDPILYGDGFDSLEGQLNDATHAIGEAIRILGKKSSRTSRKGARS